MDYRLNSYLPWPYLYFEWKLTSPLVFDEVPIVFGRVDFLILLFECLSKDHQLFLEPMSPQKS